MIVGTEWIIDAFECDAEKLRDLKLLHRIFSLVIEDLELKGIQETWHQFEGEQGITGLTLLTESHLTCHTYPEYQTATFNLYCCRNRPAWDWEKNLQKMLGAKRVEVREFQRGAVEKMFAGGNE